MTQAVKVNLPEEFERVPDLPGTASVTKPATREVIRIVAERREQALMADEYRDLADEMLSIAQLARSAQLRALPKEE
jgi:hypothetical protein